MNGFLQTVLMLFLATCSVFSQTRIKPPGPCDCSLEGILFDPDTTGTNVHSRPRGRIVATLKAETTGEKFTVHIIGHHSGWLKVSYPSGDSSRRGWIYGRLIGLWLKPQSASLYAAADIKSKVVTHVSSFYEGEQEDHPVLIIGCRKSWAFVETKDMSGKRVTGWLAPEDQCAEPYTPCAP
jgi:hypothetical protein